jgi:hypothetical protein
VADILPDAIPVVQQARSHAQAAGCPVPVQAVEQTQQTLVDKTKGRSDWPSRYCSYLVELINFMQQLHNAVYFEKLHC